MKQVLLQPAYILHRRAYRESSFLIELFTQEYGRLTVVARGVRKLRTTIGGLLQPFVPLLISWSGKGELMTLIQVETNGAIQPLQGECLFAGFYLNELLMVLLQKWDTHSQLYATYEQTLYALQGNQLEQRILRLFEKHLLEELGYGLLPKSAMSLQNTFSPDKYYQFLPEQGWISVEVDRQQTLPIKGNIFSGKSLMAIAREEWDEETILQDAKRLTRLILAPLLGARQIHSRRLFLKN